MGRTVLIHADRWLNDGRQLKFRFAALRKPDGMLVVSRLKVLRATLVGIHPEKYGASQFVRMRVHNHEES